ncbi:ATP-binding protein [Actinomadura rugatobispora]|uniref:ATP-binding protein n=1 Tax=Actinomadura rugatobispora TaxID=1994 RepID=A0ABW1ABS6_9ACTN
MEQRLGLLGLMDHLPTELIDDLHLIVSELATNACQTTPEREITFKAVFEERSIWIGVWDSSNEAPKPRQIGPFPAGDLQPDAHALDEGHESDDIGGLGLPIVIALTDERGVEFTPPEGKWVWARLKH